ncbi:two-component regulator propeller domain-containing protein [Roseateles sp. L2-2]|uniref:two-component regulator propeller domain-containing protein n=1 Tax=Roseateles sp. L2-2 TaxID=3422597 RepID=UPI003D36C507
MLRRRAVPLLPSLFAAVVLTLASAMAITPRGVAAFPDETPAGRTDHADHPAPPEVSLLAEPRFETVGIDAPVPLNIVSAIAQDRTGFLWIGTGAGLVRFDGYHFRQPGAPIENGVRSARSLGFIRALLVARDGRLWIGTEADGLAAYDPQSEKLSLFRSDANPQLPRSAVSAGTIRALAEDRDGQLWIGTIGHGLDRYDPVEGRFQHYRQGTPAGLPDDRVQSLAIDREGSLWVGTWKGLARKRAGADRFEPVFSTPGKPGLAGRIVLSLFVAPDGRVWAGTQQGDLALVDPKTGEGTLLERAEDAVNGSVNTFVALDERHLWLGRNGGLELRGVATGELLRTMKHDPLNRGSLGGNEVRALMRDRAGWIWTGGYGGGLQRHNPANTSTWVRGRDPGKQAQLIDPSTRAMVQLDTGEIWLGSNESGVTVLDEQLRSIATLRPAPGQRGGLSGGRISSLVQMKDGTVWLGSDGGLHQYTRDRQLLRVIQAGTGRARRLLAGRDGTLWIGTQDGLYRLPPGPPVQTSSAGQSGQSGQSGKGAQSGQAAQALQAAAPVTPMRLRQEGGQPLTGDVNAISETEDGGLWVGTEKGLYRLPPGGTELVVARAQPGHDLSHHSIVGLLVDSRQRLWIDTAAGLHLLTRWDGRDAEFDRISEKHGVIGRAFGANLLEDGEGRIWSQNFVYDPAKDNYYELTNADGVDIGTGWFRAYMKTRDGRLLFGGSKGVLVVTPERFEAWAYKPPLVTTELRIDGQRLAAGKLPEDGVTIGADNRSFSVEFAALDFSEPERNRYAYQLEGFDPDWISTGADLRVAVYTNLDPGKYRLRVRGTNRNGVWSPLELDIPVRVMPEWWQTWWARTLGGAALILLVYLLVALRTSYLRRSQLALEIKVRARTAELERLSLDLQAKTVALEESSLSDPLTGLRNRRFLTQHVDADVALAVRRHEQARGEGSANGNGDDIGATSPDDGDLIFFLLDLDHFKALNDRLGHAAGDAVLQQMRDRLTAVFREADYLVRWGGEEFLIVARDTSRAHAAELAERARLQVSGSPFDLGDGRTVDVTCSVGFAAFPLAPAFPRALDWAATIALADEALYAVKRSGRNGWEGVIGVPPRDDVPDLEGALRQRSRETMADWLSSGDLTVVRSSPPAASPSEA